MEYAADAGGLTRQLFRAIFNNFRFEDAFFEGGCNRRQPEANPAPSRSKVLKLNRPNLRPLSRAHERDGPKFLAPAGVKYLMTEDMDIAATLIETSDISEKNTIF